MEYNPSPVGFVGVGCPVPAPVIGVDPAAICVRTPARREVEGHPHRAEARVLLPKTIGLKRRLEFSRDLGKCPCRRTDGDNDRRQDCRRERKYGQNRGDHSAPVLCHRHVVFPEIAQAQTEPTALHELSSESIADQTIGSAWTSPTAPNETRHCGDHRARTPASPESVPKASI